MAIETPAEPQEILGQMPGLNDDDTSKILDTADFGARGLEGIYAMPLLVKCSAESASASS